MSMSENESAASTAELLAEAARALRSPSPAADRADLALRLEAATRPLESRDTELRLLSQITARAGAGLLLEEILDHVYEDFHRLIPYDRIGLALLAEGGAALTARWARAEYPALQLKNGYSAPMAGSSLEQILSSGRPRILNQLAEHLAQRPESESTRLILAEGILSSLTCPLRAGGKPIGFLFFSSRQAGTYAHEHAERFQRIADQISPILERGRLASEIAAQNRRLEEQNLELQRLGDLKNTFLGIAAHDLRGPIGNIRLAAQLATDPDTLFSESERSGFFDDIRRQADHMLGLLNDILDITAIESGKLRLLPEALHAAEFLAAEVERHRRSASVKGTRLDFDDPGPGDLRADPARLRQVLDNLVTNAVKYSPPGSRVQVLARRESAGWRIAVRDEGPGLQPEDRSRLFTDFARLSAKPTGGEKSTGLGLAIARRIVKAHGGEIGVDSPPGGGAEFWFTLPDSEPPDQPDRAEKST